MEEQAMQFKTDEQLRKYLTKKVERDIGGVKGWMFNGVSFSNWGIYFEGEFRIYVGYICDYKTLTVTLSQTYGGLTNGYGVVTEKAFNCGEACITECTTWIVEKLMEIYKQLTERTAPYINDKIMYDMLVKRPIVLRGD